MFIYLRFLKLLNIVTGKERMELPDFERPTRRELREAYEDSEQRPNRYNNLLKRARHYKLYDKYIEKRDVTMGILASSLNDEAAIEFLRDENDDDVMDPHELFTNIDDYFLYNTEIIIQNLKNEVKDMKLEKGKSMEALGKEMKVVYYYLHVLGKGEDSEAKKTNLANSILRDPSVDSTKKSVIMQIISADYYSELSFDHMINKIKNIEQYTTKKVVSAVKRAEEVTPTSAAPSKVDAEVSEYERSRARSEQLEAANAVQVHKMRFKGLCHKCGGAGHVSTECPSKFEREEASRKFKKRESYDRADKRKSNHKRQKSDKKRGKSSRRDADSDEESDSAGLAVEFDDGDSVGDYHRAYERESD